MAQRMRLVVSTVGTSLLTAHLPQDIRDTQPRFLIERANAKTLSDEEMTVVDRAYKEAEKTLQQGDTATIRKKSAELNGVYALYENQLEQAGQDMHFLIATDTVLGKRCAELVQSHLQGHRITTSQYIPPDLNTANTKDFEHGSKDLIQWCAQSIPGYRDRGYTILFNLVAAFKALQGYLNTIGMFYADDILYLFEDSEPILIPRLPIRIDQDALRPFAVPLALMAEGDADLPVEDLQDLSRAVYDTIDGRAIISDWGSLVWSQIRDELFSGSLLPFPRLRYKSSFEKDFRNTTDVGQRVALQRTLAKVAALLEKDNNNRTLLRRDGGLLYETYTNHSGIDHFRVSQNWRVNCKPEEGGLVLWNFGSHDYCEKDRLR